MAEHAIIPETLAPDDFEVPSFVGTHVVLAVVTVDGAQESIFRNS